MTRSSPYLSIVLPAHNEVELLEGAVAELASALRQRELDFEIVVVENGSTDGTAELAHKITAPVPELRVVELERPDYGAAVATGFRASRGDIVVHFDVDLIDMAFLGEGTALIESRQAGIVLASKRAPGATDDRPAHRRILTAGFTLAMRLLLAVPVTDAHGMKVLSRSACAPSASACKMTGALYDVELVLRASRAGVIVAELPADVREIRPPRTPVWHRSVESASGLLRLRILLWKERLRARKPPSATTEGTAS
ncbi:MAG: glycosyltransferase [Acidimicrobiales bacterium]